MPRPESDPWSLEPAPENRANAWPPLSGSAASRTCLTTPDRSAASTTRQRSGAARLRRVRAERRRKPRSSRWRSARGSSAARSARCCRGWSICCATARSMSHYQGAAFRFYHQASATERGALFNPDYNLEELDFLRAHTPAGGVFVDVGANVGTYAMVLARHVGASRQGDRHRAAPGHPCAAGLQPRRIRLHAGDACRRGRRRRRRRVDDRDRRRQSRRQPHRVGAQPSTSNAIKVPSLRLQRILADAGVRKSMRSRSTSRDMRTGF